MEQLNLNIKKIINESDYFIDKLETSDGYKLFKRSEVSPFARCFVIFNKSLIKKLIGLKKEKNNLIEDLNNDLYKLYKKKLVTM